MSIQLSAPDSGPFECATVIGVPAAALEEGGHIRLFAVDQTGQSKHEFHALAQMAFIQSDDGDLQARPVRGPMTIRAPGETLLIEDGAVIGRLSPDGAVAVWSNSSRPAHKFLEAANRYCTRWIRLDI